MSSYAQFGNTVSNGSTGGSTATVSVNTTGSTSPVTGQTTSLTNALPYTASAAAAAAASYPRIHTDGVDEQNLAAANAYSSSGNLTMLGAATTTLSSPNSTTPTSNTGATSLYTNPYASGYASSGIYTGTSATSDWSSPATTPYAMANGYNTAAAVNAAAVAGAYCPIPGTNNTITGAANPYGDPSFAQAQAYGYGYDMSDGVRRKNATRESTNTLKAWLNEHKKNPYPTKGEKIMLAIITKMTLTQVSTWFANARRRLKKENKMTWIPKNRSADDNSGKSEDEEEDQSKAEGLKLEPSLRNVTRNHAMTAPVDYYTGSHVGQIESTDPSQQQDPNLSHQNGHDIKIEPSNADANSMQSLQTWNQNQYQSDVKTEAKDDNSNATLYTQPTSQELTSVTTSYSGATPTYGYPHVSQYNTSSYYSPNVYSPAMYGTGHLQQTSQLPSQQIYSSTYPTSYNGNSTYMTTATGNYADSSVTNVTSSTQNSSSNVETTSALATLPQSTTQSFSTR